MATNYVNPGGNLKFIPSSAVVSGALGLYDNIIGVALSTRTTAELADVTRNDEVNQIAIATQGIFNVPVEGAATITKGIKVYLISGNMVTNSAGGGANAFVGTSNSAEYSDGTADVILNMNLTGF